jgi:hypothetical protein
MSENKVIVQIPRELYEKIKTKIKGTSFGTVDEYIILKLENEFPVELEYSEDEEKIIRERLRRLGYIE